MASSERHIIAIGGLVSDANSSAIFRYALEHARNAAPAVGFLATASGDSSSMLSRFYEMFAAFPGRTSHLSLFERAPNVPEYVAGLDVVIVGGGNVRSLLAVWRGWNLPRLLTNAWISGTVLAGWSAGASCWFEQSLSEASGGAFESVTGLGLLKGGCSPHYADEPARRPAFVQALRQAKSRSGIGIDGGAAVHFVGFQPTRLLCPSGAAGARAISVGDTGASEAPLAAERLPVPGA